MTRPETGTTGERRATVRVRRSLEQWLLAYAAAAILVTLATAKVASAQQNFKTVFDFHFPRGAFPVAGLVQGLDGDFYGTTSQGGVNDLYGGTVFKITPGGKITTLYSFCFEFSCTDGEFPNAGLVQATDGNLYGTTVHGGAYTTSECNGSGCGTVFKIMPGGTLTTLYSFCPKYPCTDGQYPYAGLVQATDGNFYGTTYEGGSDSYYGTIFKVTPSGTLTTLHSFDSADGAYPLAALIQAADGNFYGTTFNGGSSGSCSSGCGTVFKITVSGTLTTLHSFDFTDGANPDAGLVQGTDGDLYGTTAYGGANSNDCNPYSGYVGCGTVFKISRSGSFTTLHSFDSADGANPYAGLVQATDGNLYGTTPNGGSNPCGGPGCGTVFKMTPTGTLTTLHSFDLSDGAVPHAALVQATDGTFYGTTTNGGANNFCAEQRCGTIFNLGVGLAPFVETLPSSGKVGMFVKILGTNLTHATSVTFNGTPAVFSAEGSSIVTRVPAGATTGAVQVVTPDGTLSGNVPFRVIQ